MRKSRQLKILAMKDWNGKRNDPLKDTSRIKKDVHSQAIKTYKKSQTVHQILTLKT